jgi:hypothetical protein
MYFNERLMNKISMTWKRGKKGKTIHRAIASSFYHKKNNRVPKGKTTLSCDKILVDFSETEMYNYSSLVCPKEKQMRWKARQPYEVKFEV